MSEFMKSSTKLDEIAAGATSFEQLREEMKAQLVRDGAIARDPRDGYGVRNLAQTEPPPVPLAAADVVREDHNKCVRVVYPSGNNRFEIYGASEAELDATEAKIRAMF